MPRRSRVFLALCVGVSSLALNPHTGQAQAPNSPHNQVVSADPVEETPHVLDGKVTAILPMGNRIVVGGTFTQVKNKGESTILTRKGLFVFDTATGRVAPNAIADFDIDPPPAPPVDPNNPDVDPEEAPGKAVEALALDPSGNAFFVGGTFGTVATTPGIPLSARKVVKLNFTSGAEPALSASAPFNSKLVMNQAVKDLVVTGDKLIIAGAFTRVNSPSTLNRAGLAAVNVNTGDLDPDLDVAFTVPYKGDVPRVETIAVTPDGKKLVAGGNFTLVDGQPRVQLAMIDLVNNEVEDWHTERLNFRDPVTGLPKCAEKFKSHPRDLDVSPDGSYFVMVTTGGYSRGSLCDTVTRWEISARGSNLEPTWIDYDGGDSFTGLAVTGSAVYVGGHNRWFNNPKNNGSSVDATAGPGAVVREGIAALDPVSGLPFPWNPGRERGEGAWAIAATPDGLWVGSDTDNIGGRVFDPNDLDAPDLVAYPKGEFHQKIAFFPLAGGSTVTPFNPHGLPADLYALGAGGISKRHFTGSQLGAATALTSTTDWNKVRGAFSLNDRIYTGQSDGTLLMRKFDGSQPFVVNQYGLGHADVDGPVHYGWDIDKVSGMFYDKGRLYFTYAGDKKLYYRYFFAGGNPADDIIGAQTFTVSGETDGMDWSVVKGMTFAGGRIYYSDGTDLRRVDMADGTVDVATKIKVVSGAGINARGLVLMPVTTTPPPVDPDPLPPTTTPPTAPAGDPPPSGTSNTARRSGYWMVGSDGRVYSFGEAKSHGEATSLLGGANAVDLEPTPSFNGYWIVDDAGRVFGFGDARHHGNVDGARLTGGEKVTSISATPSGNGYWVFTNRGRVVAFGDAGHFGDMSAVKLNGPVLDSIRTRTGRGYYMVGSDGGIFAFGDAKFYGSMGNAKLNAPVQSLVPDGDGVGYWLVASDGGIFAFDAAFRGSMGSAKLNKPMTGMVPFGTGYLMVGEDGGIFNFSDKQFFGSLGGNPPARPVVSVAALDG